MTQEAALIATMGAAAKPSTGAHHCPEKNPHLSRFSRAATDRIREANVSSVVSAYEDRIRKLEEDKLILRDRLSENTRPKSGFEETLRTALDFLASPWILRRSKRLEDRRTVPKLAFADRLRYTRENRFRTANLAFPFKVLSALGSGDLGMARCAG